ARQNRWMPHTLPQPDPNAQGPAVASASGTTPAPRTPQPLSAGDISRIVEMAWEDRTPFEDVEREYGLPEAEVIALMRRTMKPSSFRMWRKRMAGRQTKHRGLNEARRAG
ncbi:MAG: TIGR03643 family protein, partial [Acidovorax sp.]|nr:TIGR03643 family protein [Acidovorax sp.]